MSAAHKTHYALCEVKTRAVRYIEVNNNKKSVSGNVPGIDQHGVRPMALNLLLLAFAPEISRFADRAAKPSPLRRLYDFIVRSQTRRADHEVARYLEETGRHANRT